jgi:hypothetical protein
VTHPVYLTVAVWAALFVLGILVLIVYRQLGRVFAATAPSSELGPSPGTKTKAFDYLRLSDQSSRSFVPGGGAPALLAFVDPTCATCEALVESLGRAKRAGELSGLRVLLIVSDPPEYIQISEIFRSTQFELGHPQTAIARDEYKAFATPLLVALDAEGVVRAAGPATEMKDIRAFRESALSPPPADTLIVGTEASNGRAPQRLTETVTLQSGGTNS